MYICEIYASGLCIFAIFYATCNTRIREWALMVSEVSVVWISLLCHKLITWRRLGWVGKWDGGKNELFRWSASRLCANINYPQICLIRHHCGVPYNLLANINASQNLVLNPLNIRPDALIEFLIIVYGRCFSLNTMYTQSRFSDLLCFFFFNCLM